MNLVVLYLLLLKASATSFSGLGSLPMIRSDLVVERHVLTDRQLNTAVAAGRPDPALSVCTLCASAIPWQACRGRSPRSSP